MKTFYHFIMDPRRGGPHQFVKNFTNATNKKIKNYTVINGKKNSKLNLYFLEIYEGIYTFLR